MEPLKTSIIIIDDHQLFREGVKRILDFEASFDVVAEGDDGSEAISWWKNINQMLSLWISICPI